MNPVGQACLQTRLVQEMWASGQGHSLGPRTWAATVEGLVLPQDESSASLSAGPADRDGLCLGGANQESAGATSQVREEARPQVEAFLGSINRGLMWEPRFQRPLRV